MRRRESRPTPAISENIWVFHLPFSLSVCEVSSRPMTILFRRLNRCTTTADPRIPAETIAPRITPTIRRSKRRRGGGGATEISSREMEFHEPFRRLAALDSSRYRFRQLHLIPHWPDLCERPNSRARIMFARRSGTYLLIARTHMYRCDF